MTAVTIELKPKIERLLLKATGARTATEAVVKLVADAAKRGKLASALPAPAQVSRALRQSLKEEKAGAGKTFNSAPAAMKWLES